jgi:hypothetical protein
MGGKILLDCVLRERYILYKLGYYIEFNFKSNNRTLESQGLFVSLLKELYVASGAIMNLFTQT